MNNILGWLFIWPIIATFGIISILFGILFFAFWIWMIVDCIQREFNNSDEKIIWAIIVILAGIVGALIYYFVVRISNPKGLSKRRKR